MLAGHQRLVRTHERVMDNDWVPLSPRKQRTTGRRRTACKSVGENVTFAKKHLRPARGSWGFFLSRTPTQKRGIAAPTGTYANDHLALYEARCAQPKFQNPSGDMPNLTYTNTCLRNRLFRAACQMCRGSLILDNVCEMSPTIG